MPLRALLAAAALALVGCDRTSAPPAPVDGPRTGDLPAIRASGELRVLVEAAEDALLPDRGPSAQTERLRLKDFAREQGVAVRFVTVDAYEKLIPALVAGEGDVI